MKYLRIISAGLAMALLPMGAFAQGAQPAKVEGAIFSGAAGDVIETELNFDPMMLIEKDNHAFDRELAEFSALVSADIYFRDKDLAKGTQNRVLIGGNEDSYTHTALLDGIGFTDTRYVESYKAVEYPADANDSVVLLMGYRNVEDKYDEYVFAVRGCFSIGEWLSAYDVGCDSEAYAELTGAHAEWTETGVWKGIDIAANRAMGFIGDYMKEHDDPEREDIVLITGHSRGGAIANLAGAEMEAGGAAKVFTYTFSGLNYVKSEMIEPRDTVFNIFDSGDFFTDILPFANETYSRYGTDISMDIAKSDTARARIAELKGRDDHIAVTAEERGEFERLFAERFADRASLYEPRQITETFDTRAVAEARVADCGRLIGKEEGLDIGMFCEVSEVTETGAGFEIGISYRDAALLTAYARLLAYGSSVYDAITELFAGDEGGVKVAAWLRDHMAELKGGHLLINGYVIAEIME